MRHVLLPFHAITIITALTHFFGATISPPLYGELCVVCLGVGGVECPLWCGRPQSFQRLKCQGFNHATRTFSISRYHNNYCVDHFFPLPPHPVYLLPELAIEVTLVVVREQLGAVAEDCNGRRPCGDLYDIILCCKRCERSVVGTV